MKFAFILIISLVMFSCSKEKTTGQGGKVYRCDTAHFVPSLSLDVTPVLSTSCTYSCHNSINHQGSWDFTHYNDTLGNYGLHSAATSGALSCSITHDPICGYEAMPRNKPKIDSCSIAIVVKWVRSGAPRN